MNEKILPILGIIGNTLLLVAYVPQLLKILRTKSVEDLSLPMWILWFVGDVCFLAYSLIEKDLYSSILFAVFTIENTLLLYLFYRYQKA